MLTPHCSARLSLTNACEYFKIKSIHEHFIYIIYTSLYVYCYFHLQCRAFINSIISSIIIIIKNIFILWHCVVCSSERLFCLSRLWPQRGYDGESNEGHWLHSYEDMMIYCNHEKNCCKKFAMRQRFFNSVWKICIHSRVYTH